jgi:hypothetical protein
MEPQTSPPEAEPKQRGPLVVIIIVVGALIIVGGAIAVWKFTGSSSSSSGAPAGQTAKGLYKAWQSGNKTAAAKYASPTAVTAIFKIAPSEASGMQFDQCSATGNNPFPKECVWSRPGGELTMTVNKPGDTPTVTNVKYGPAGLPPDTSTSG